MWHKEKKCHLPRDGILVLVSLGRMWTSPVSSANWLMPEGQLLGKSLLDATGSYREHLRRTYITSSPPPISSLNTSGYRDLCTVPLSSLEHVTIPEHGIFPNTTKQNHKTTGSLSTEFCYPPPGKLGCADRTSLFALVPIPKPRTKSALASNRRLQNLEIIQPHPTQSSQNSVLLTVMSVTSLLRALVSSSLACEVDKVVPCRGALTTDKSVRRKCLARDRR